MIAAKLRRLRNPALAHTSHDRKDFFLACSFRDLDDLNWQLAHWLDTVANCRAYATTQRVLGATFAEERLCLRPLPLAPFRWVLKLERHLSRDGIVSVDSNLYSVPDATRRRWDFGPDGGVECR